MPKITIKLTADDNISYKTNDIYDIKALARIMEKVRRDHRHIYKNTPCWYWLGQSPVQSSCWISR